MTPIADVVLTTTSPSAVTPSTGSGGLVTETGTGGQNGSASVSPTILIAASVSAAVVALIVIAVLIWRCLVSQNISSDTDEVMSKKNMHSLFPDYFAGHGHGLGNGQQRHGDDMDLKFWQVYESDKNGVLVSDRLSQGSMTNPGIIVNNHHSESNNTDTDADTVNDLMNR